MSSEHGQIPIGGAATTRHQSPVHATVTQRGGGAQQGMKEQKESLGEGVEQVKRVGEKMYEQACDFCHNWRHYPKLLTFLLLTSAFLTGALVSGGVQKMGIFGGSRHYVSSHWDRETADAHHALDVVLDHLKHPYLYEGAKAESYLTKARRSISDIFGGMLPSRMKSGYGQKDYYESARDTGRDVYDKMAGRRGLGDKLSEYGEDLSYGARRGVETAKDVGYGLSDKLGDMAESVKQKFTGDRDMGYGREYTRGGGGGGIGSWLGGGRDTDSGLMGQKKKGWFGGGGDDSGMMGQKKKGWFSSGGDDSSLMGEKKRGWLGGGASDEYHRGEDDEFGMAADKVRKVVRQAEREM